MRRFSPPLAAVALFASSLLGGRALAADYNQELTRIGKELTQCLSGPTRLKVAAVDFTDLQGGVTELGRLLAEELSTELTIVSGRQGPQVVDRNHLATVLKEHELGASGLIDPETTKQLGQFAGIDIVITGNVLALEDSIRMTVKAIETETATVACASRGEFPKTMVMREMLAMGVGGGGRETGAASGGDGNPAGQADIDAAEAQESARLTPRLISFTKRRDGREVHVAIGVTAKPPSQEWTGPFACPGLALGVNTDRPPQLIDNTGTDWSFVRSGGVPAFSANALKYQPAPMACFDAGVEQVITLVFRGDSSAGTEFTLAGSFAAAQVKQPYKQGLFDVPLGVANIRLK